MDKRTRSACWKCKERRVRCSLERPTCRNCARSNHRCQYGLKLLWREDALARGICHGRQGVHGRRTSTAPLFNDSLGLRGFTGDFYFFNVYSDDFEDQDGYVQSDETEADRSYLDNGVTFSPEPPLYYFPLSGSGEDKNDGQLFDYYINGLCPNLSNSPTENPYIEFIAPLSTTSASLFHSILSWSAHELASRDPTGSHYRQLSVQHKLKALQGLRNEVECSGNVSAPSAQALTSILSTMIILSCQDITESCSSAWISHLKAARTLCSIMWPKGSEHVDRFRKFCLMWFVSHEMMSRTAWVQETLFEPSDWFAGDDESEIDAMIGCSRGLVHQVSEIGKLIMEKRLDASRVNTVSFLSRRDRIEHALQSLGQRISTTAAAAPGELLNIAESKRLCTLIYLYTSIDGATPLSPAVQEMAASVIELLQDLPPKPSLTFPLFVVGTLGVWNEDDRRLVLDKFTQLIRTRPLASIVKASEIVKAVWVDRDLGKHDRWEDLVESRGQLLSLA